MGVLTEIRTGIDLTGITNLPMDMDTINLTDTDINPFMEAMDITMEATDITMVATDITINLGTTNVSMTPMEDTIPVTREVTSPTENPMDLMEMIIHMVKKITMALMITMITITRRTTTIMTSLNMSITKKNTNTNMVINLKIMASIIKIFRKLFYKTNLSISDFTKNT